MARYIDADKLIENLQVDFDKQGQKSDDMALRGETELSVKYNHGQYCYLNAIEQVKDAPTADVVPKSEVELYKRQVDELEDELASTYDKLENAKAEVAREIFEEIDKQTKFFREYMTLNNGCKAMIGVLDELKKKYTEGV